MLFAFVAWIGRGQAAEQRVGVAAHDASLRNAIEAVLAPWGVSAVAVDRFPTTTAVTEATEQARAIAQERGLAALVWTAGGSMWIFDAATEQLSVRPLPAPTLDDATATAAALSVKATLRETFAPRAADVSTTAPGAAAHLPAPSAWPSPSFSALPASPMPPTSSQGGPLRLDILLVGGVRPWTGVAAPEAWAGVGASLWPQAWNERVGFELSGRAGFGVGVARPSFAGRYAHDSVAAYGLGRLPFAGWGALEIGPGFSLEVVTLQGTVFGSPPRVELERVDPAVLARGALEARIGARVRLGATLDAVYLLRYQQYLVDTDRILQQPSLTLDLGLRFSIEVN